MKVREASGISAVEYEHCGFFYLRTPLLTWDRFVRWAEIQDDKAGRDALHEIFRDPVHAEALQLASDGLSRALLSRNDQDGRKIDRALLRYFSRMCGRSTPFGLFAGCSFGRIGPTQDLAVSPESEWRRALRLDMDYIARVVRVLSADHGIRKLSRLRANTTLYSVEDFIRWIEITSDVTAKRRKFKIAQSENSEILQVVLTKAHRPILWADLFQIIVAVVDETEPAEIETFLHDLIDSQVLLVDIEPPITGEQSQLSWLLAALRPTLEASELSRATYEACSRIDSLLSQIARAPLGEARLYEETRQVLSTLPVETPSTSAFQVDLLKPTASLSLQQKLASEFARDTSRLWAVLSGMPNRPLQDFTERFEHRYGESEVPLLLALDPDVGLVYDEPPTISPLIADLRPLQRSVALAPARRDQEFWEARIREAIWRHERELSLSPKDLDTLAALRNTFGHLTPAPDGLMWRCSLYASTDTTRDEYRILVDRGVGPSISRMLGRFASSDQTLAEALQQECQREQAGHSGLLAEIVHLPTDRAGNVVIRPMVRALEIPVLALGSASSENQVLPGELTIRLIGGRFVLFCRRLGARIVPRMANAHNYTLPWNIPVYKFLCALQQEDSSSSDNLLPQTMQAGPFVPRVRFRNLILHPATWNIYGEIAASIQSSKGSLDALRKWREEYAVPRHCILQHEDGIVIDLENRLCVESLLHTLKLTGKCRLTELMPDGFTFAVRQDGMPIAHEMMVPLRRKTKPVKSTLGKAQTELGKTIGVHTFRPGTDWLFIKLYGNESHLDRLLATSLQGALRDLHGQTWFFIRYADPEPHLRIRIRALPENQAALLRKLNAAGAQDTQYGCWKVSLATYEREVQRYGGNEGIELAERIFTADSNAAVKAAVCETPRWLAALLGMDRMLDDAGFSGPERLSWLETQRDAFVAEFGMSTPQLRVMGARYRGHQDMITNARSAAGSQLDDIYQGRSRETANAWTEIRALDSAGRLTVPMSSLVASFLHMHVNRMIAHSARMHEMVLYDMLLRDSRRRVATERERSH